MADNDATNSFVIDPYALEARDTAIEKYAGIFTALTQAIHAVRSSQVLVQDYPSLNDTVETAIRLLESASQTIACKHDEATAMRRREYRLAMNAISEKKENS